MVTIVQQQTNPLGSEVLACLLSRREHTGRSFCLMHDDKSITTTEGVAENSNSFDGADAICWAGAKGFQEA